MVAIKGMNMPYGCMDCRFGYKYGLVGDCHCTLTDDYYTNNPKPPYKERPDECPLVPVPEEWLATITKETQNEDSN